MKKLMFIMLVALTIASCKKEQVEPNTPVGVVSDTDIEGTYSRLVGEWLRTEVNIGGGWQKAPHSFVVTKTTLDNAPYTVIAKDKVQLNNGNILEFTFTKDTSIVRINNTILEKWTL